MGKLGSVTLAGIFFSLVAGLASPGAGEWHYRQSMACSDCHTMHNRKDNAPMRYDRSSAPAAKLLRHATGTSLCLHCHDGTNVTAPDVLAPVTMYSGSGDEHSGGGSFERGQGMASNKSHDLGVSSSVPLSTMGRVTLTCSSCHDPHGNGNYRNLLMKPNPFGAGTPVALGTDVFEEVSPANPPTQQGTINAYKRSNIGYKSNMGSWCGECHDTLASNEAGSASAHFMNHPNNVAFNTYSPSRTNPSHWVEGQGEGFGTATGDSSEGVPRVRFQVPTASNFAEAKTVSPGNEVFCLSCHVAHGGSYEKALVWPFRESTGGIGGKDMISACQQCHFQ